MQIPMDLAGIYRTDILTLGMSEFVMIAILLASLTRLIVDRMIERPDQSAPCAGQKFSRYPLVLPR